MTTFVDARGFSCPQPALMARRALAEGRFPIQVLVDSGAARENVTRLAERAGCQVEVETNAAGEFVLTIRKQ